MSRASDAIRFPVCDATKSVRERFEKCAGWLYASTARVAQLAEVAAFEQRCRCAIVVLSMMGTHHALAPIQSDDPNSESTAFCRRTQTANKCRYRRAAAPAAKNFADCGQPRDGDPVDERQCQGKPVWSAAYSHAPLKLSFRPRPSASPKTCCSRSPSNPYSASVQRSFHSHFS